MKSQIGRCLFYHQQLPIIPKLESVGEALLDFQNISDLESWFKNNSLDFYS